MASVTKDKNGHRKVQFCPVGGGPRKTIRLGDVTAKQANTVKVNIESIMGATLTRTPIDAVTAHWISDLDDSMHNRLARVGLVPARARVNATLDSMLTSFFAGVEVKPATKVRMEQARTALLEYFGPDKAVRSIGETDAEEWRAKLRADGYAAATVSRTVLYARQMFRWAVRRGMAIINPFAELKAGPQTNPARQAYIDQVTIGKVIDAAPDVEWRLLIVLSRYGGLRCPSEHLALRWADVDWENNRLRVRSTKTEHHEGGSERFVPIFPEIRRHLMEAFERAEPGTKWVIARYRDPSCNLRTQFERIITRAGVSAWPKLWHNLRASRQTELAAAYPLATVCAWIGNSKMIAAGHYLQVTDADWTRAVGADQGGKRTAQNAAQYGAGTAGKDKEPRRDERKETAVLPGKTAPYENIQECQVGGPGLEPGTLRV